MSEIIFILVSFTLLILVIVGIHELGHFLAARWFNVQEIQLDFQLYNLDLIIYYTHLNRISLLQK